MLKPLRNNVILKISDEETKTSSGIYVPNTVKDKTLIGTVIAIGPGILNEKKQLVPVSVKVGDKVVYEFSDIKLNDNKENYIVVKEENIVAIIE
jgi:chaperonin GroES